ncbi:MAG: LamG domain-containing protein, partial [Armatimonadetes bacterium]|nr:LamG domain-containing protein [Armatimonadota bacterium]
MPNLMCLGVLIAVACTAASADAFTLTREGKPAATIVLAGEPTQAAEFAAQELQAHVRLISGAVLPIVSDAVAVQGPRVLVGESKATAKAGLRGADFETQEYLIRIRPEALILIGCDEVSSANPNAPSYAEGKHGKALSFDGRDDAVVVPDCAFHDEAGSLECWVYLPEAPQERESTLLRLDGAGPWSYHILRRWPNTSSLGYTTYNGEVGSSVSSGELAPGWHHVLATHDAAAGVQELFVDGV